MVGFWTGVDKSQIDAKGLEHQGGTLFSLKLDDLARGL